jgi:hypothetical protein
MRRRIQRIVGIGVLVLAAGCATGAGLFTDLPQTQPLPRVHDPDDVLIPVRHPPDGSITAREPAPHWERNLNGALSRLLPLPNWANLLLVIPF